MPKRVSISILLTLLALTGPLPAAAVILNEYNAVDPTSYLGGGTVIADDSGGRAADSFFGRVPGNGGDWFELVVITDLLDMRNWKLDIYLNGVLDETLNLTDHARWFNLRSGTIITVSEDVPNDVSYTPNAGDWWINVQANDAANGVYIENSNFAVNSSNWQLVIRDAAGAVVFGPAGEGVSPVSGVSGTEIFRLEADPSAAILPGSLDYDDAADLSTFGAPNHWGQQNFAAIRTVGVPASTITLLAPNGSEILKSGDVFDVTWTYTGTLRTVCVEFSDDGGGSWSPVYPPNVGNTGAYAWLVPMLDSEACRLRVSNAASPGVADVSNADFTVYRCAVQGDLTGDCIADLDDLQRLAAAWLACGNPYDPACQ